MFYIIPRAICSKRLTAAMDTQQTNPMKIGFVPVFIRETMFVLRPMAAIAMTIKNLLRSFNGLVTVPGRAKTVVITDASTKNKMNIGKARLKLNVEAPSFFLRACKMPRTRVIGIMAKVLVSLTMVAASRVLLPWIPSHAAAAAVTEDVSLTAVPAKSPNPSLERPKAVPREGKIRAAATLNRKMTEIDWAISSSSASITGAAAAMAEPPQMEEPIPIRVEIFASI